MTSSVVFQIERGTSEGGRTRLGETRLASCEEGHSVGVLFTE